jgi:hypothetical protein
MVYFDRRKCNMRGVRRHNETGVKKAKATGDSNATPTRTTTNCQRIITHIQGSFWLSKFKYRDGIIGIEREVCSLLICIS